MRIGLMPMLFEREIEWIGALYPNINDKNCSNNNATDEQILFPSHDIYKLVTTIRSKDKPISQEVLATQPCAHSCSSEIGRNDETEKDKPQYPLHTHHIHPNNIMHSMTTNQLRVYTKDAYIDYLRPIYWFFFSLLPLFLLFCARKFFVSSLTVFFISSSHAYNNQNRPRKKRMHTHTRNGSIQTNKKVFFVYDFNNRRIRNN